MRVLHVLDHYLPFHSGYTFRSGNILAQQRAFGWDPVVLTSPKHDYPDGSGPEKPDWLSVHHAPLGRGGARGLVNRVPFAGQHALMRDLRKELAATVARVGNVDLVHAHSPALNGLPAVQVRDAGGPPVVYEVRALWEDAAVDLGNTTPGSLRYRATAALETRLLRRADRIVVLCKALEREFVSRGIDADKITVVGNGVDPERFAARDPDPALRDSLGLGTGPVIGFLGSFYAYEGLPMLVDAAAPILRDRPDARLLLVGGGPDESAIRDRVAASGVAEQIVMPGRVPHETVPDHYALVDLLVYPRLSNRLTELTTPLKPLEAMAFGKAVLGSDVGGIDELIGPAGDGAASFPAGDRDALTRAIRALIDAPEQRARMATLAREYVLRERTWAVQVGRYREVYAGALGRDLAHA